MERKEPFRSPLRVVAVSAAAALALSACSSSSNMAPAPTNPSERSVTNLERIDLLKDTSWTLPGAVLRDGALYVSNVDMAIVDQDGSEAYKNPAINLYGTHLEHQGNFEVSFGLKDQKGESTISLYAKPPIIEDEFRSEQGMLDLTSSTDSLRVSLSNIQHGKNAQVHEFVISSPEPKIDVSVKSDIISISIDGIIQPETFAAQGMFDTTEVWVGATSSESFTLGSLSARSLNSGTLTASNKIPSLTQNSNGIATLVAKKRPDMIFGAAVAAGPLVNDSGYRRLLSEYNGITTENAGKWQFIHPQPDVYNFAEMDGIVDAAQKGGYFVHGHTLIFGEANPAWVQELDGNPEALKKAATDHIKTIVGRYKGKVSSWDVINEPLPDYDTEPGNGGLRDNIWNRTLGPDYVEIMLRAAHEANPTAELWINEFGLESDDERFDQMLKLIIKLKALNTPLTGIGFESHIDEGDAPTGRIDEEVLKTRIDTLSKLGLKIRFSEVDIDSEEQSPVPSQIIRVCMAKTACSGVTTWGITDRFSSGGSIDSSGRFTPGEGLLFDRNDQPTEAYKTLQKSLTTP